jgi:nitrogen fixation protein FixH
MATIHAMNDNGFRLSGRMVLFGLIGFFGLIAAANAVLIWLAVSTGSGVVVSSSYRAGNDFQAEIDAANAQAARHWSVAADVTRSGDGAAIDLTVRDASGSPVSGLAVAASFVGHTGEAGDRGAILSEGEVGRYRGVVDQLAVGNWLLVIDATRGEERVYRSENRVMLR